MKLPPIVSPQEWETARQALLVEEKELTRARDAMAAKRRRMPWMEVEKDYRFDGPLGQAPTLVTTTGVSTTTPWCIACSPATHSCER